MSGIAIADVAIIPSNSHRHLEESERPPLALAKLYQSTGRPAERTPCSRETTELQEIAEAKALMERLA
jgi:hypothetical protein